MYSSETGGLLDDAELQNILNIDTPKSTKIELNLLEDIHDPSDYVQYSKNKEGNGISHSIITDQNILNNSHGNNAIEDEYVQRLRTKQKRNRISQRDVNQRLESYLKDSDDNCKESATLVAIVVIGLIVTGSVIGFLQLGHNDVHVRYKGNASNTFIFHLHAHFTGAHAENVHMHGEMIPNLENWFNTKVDNVEQEMFDDSLSEIEELGIQPIYRNYLLQTMYEYSFKNYLPIVVIHDDQNDGENDGKNDDQNVGKNVNQKIDQNVGENVNQKVDQKVGKNVNKKIDHIFNHVSMIYGGPWNVPPIPIIPTIEDLDINMKIHPKRRLTDDEIPIVLMKNGKTEHTFTFPTANNEIKDQHYKNNENQWHCYLFEFANAINFHQKGYAFRISTQMVNFRMESGFDFVRMYINSQYNGQSFTGNIKMGKEFVFRVDNEYLSQWHEKDIPSFELCYNIITDESITDTGFTIITNIAYENPLNIQWSTNPCTTAKPNWRNPKRWDGKCGVGIQTREISKCDIANAMKYSPNTNQISTDIKTKEKLDIGECKIHEQEVKFCEKSKCKTVDNHKHNFSKDEKMKYHFNGISRIDPTFADPFVIKRSTNTMLDIEKMISELNSFSSKIVSEFSDIRILKESVIFHKYMNDSKLRLGMKLARSLILGDTFSVAFTGSSNTAGHDNLFMSSFPMQLQSLLRPLWYRIGFKGAAFEVKNRAVGGSLGTDQMTWCIPQLTGGTAEKIDVVFWESMMNDAGSKVSRKHTIENHLRNTLSMKGGTYNDNHPNRPLWHAIHAGSNGNQPKKFGTKGKIYEGIRDLLDLYSHEYGAGMVEFEPFMGMNPAKVRDKRYSDEECYVSWHPGPKGHKIYAQIIAYFYVQSCLEVLEDVQQTIDQLVKITWNKPIVEMLELLEDPPYKTGLPPANNDLPVKCEPICTDSGHQSCITGLHPRDSVFDVRSYVVDAAKWKYKLIAGNPQSLMDMKGGQASIDSKYGYSGNKNSGELVLKIKIDGHHFLLIEKPYSDWGKLNGILKKMHEWFHVRIIKSDVEKEKGMKMKCESDKHLWNSDIISFGCVIHFHHSGKYEIGISVDVEQDIPLLVFATY